MSDPPPRYQFTADHWVTPPAPTLDEPLYGASFGEAIARFFKKYATFRGRASRSEYWFAWLFLLLIQTVFAVVLLILVLPTLSSTTGPPPTLTPIAALIQFVFAAVALGTLVPNLAVLVRRLHDTDHSGWYYFVTLVPLVGGIILFVFTVSGSDPRGSRFD